MTRRAIVSPRLPELRSGNAEIDRWVERYLQVFVTQVADRIKELTPEEGEFAPTWLGFSTDPVGNISYQDDGEFVWLWVDAALTGVSDETFMQLSGLPEAIRPSANRYIPCLLLDESTLYNGLALVDSDGGITFTLDAGTFTDPSTLGYKGLVGGWLIQYPK
jgi:hypothetical protein